MNLLPAPWQVIRQGCKFLKDHGRDFTLNLPFEAVTVPFSRTTFFSDQCH